jgi:hypothetical protein
LNEHDDARAHNLLGEAALESGDLDTAQNEFALALSAAPRYFQAAQDNLDLVNKRIAEKAMGGAPIEQAAAGARAAPPPDAAVTAAASAEAPANRYYSQAWYRAANQGKKARKDARQAAASSSCAGAAASKARCNPATAKRPKSYQVASARRPRT